MKNVVLLGGGHSHALALLRMANAEARITLVSDEELAPYSGMLPGFIAGQFSRAECMINLPALCRQSGAAWRPGKVRKIEPAARRVVFEDGDALEYDLLSVNVGGAQVLPGPLADGVCIKPVHPFMDFVESLKSPASLAVAGAGAGGVETALAFRRRFPSARIALSGDSFLHSANAGVRRRMRSALERKGISWLESPAIAFSNGRLELANGREAEAEHAVFATPVAAPPCLAGGLTLDEGGFAKVNSFLQTPDFPEVFAAGDCASSGAPKSGAAAVRQAPVLAHNLLAFIRGAPLRPWRLRRNFLYILNSADGRATAGFGRFAAGGAWAWAWKKHLDMKFMRRFPQA